MVKKLFLGISITLILSCSLTSLGFNSDELNKRLTSCTPTKDFDAGSSMYQISGLTGSTCIFKIQYKGFGTKPDLICKVPFSRMKEMTSYNPISVNNIKNQYCIISIKSLNRAKSVYY